MSDEKQRYCHIIKRRDPKKTIFSDIADNITKQAPMRTLCGKLWRDAGDAYKLPSCPECVAAMEPPDAS